MVEVAAEHEDPRLEQGLGDDPLAGDEGELRRAAHDRRVGVGRRPPAPRRRRAPSATMPSPAPVTSIRTERPDRSWPACGERPRQHAHAEVDRQVDGPVLPAELPAVARRRWSPACPRRAGTTRRPATARGRSARCRRRASGKRYVAPRVVAHAARRVPAATRRPHPTSRGARGSCHSERRFTVHAFQRVGGEELAVRAAPGTCRALRRAGRRPAGPRRCRRRRGAPSRRGSTSPPAALGSSHESGSANWIMRPSRWRSACAMPTRSSRLIVTCRVGPSRSVPGGLYSRRHARPGVSRQVPRHADGPAGGARRSSRGWRRERAPTTCSTCCRWPTAARARSTCSRRPRTAGRGA